MASHSIHILGIESSCDDTSVSIVTDGKVLSNFTISQWIHQKYGGVVPEAASRLHVESIVELTAAALTQAGIEKKQLSAVAVTRGPGLIGSLLVGISFAKSLSLSLQIPIIEVNHLQAHVMSLFIDQAPRFPMIGMTVSGGHTQLLLIRDYADFEILGQTLDDAAGEAFDKTGKLLGLPYPAGPEMDKWSKSGSVRFPFPIAQVADYGFSFSGLKTAVLYFLKDQLKQDPQFIENNLADLCASVQDNICKTLLIKLKKAAIQYEVRSVGVAGGVSANSQLRKELQELCTLHEWQLLVPKLSYCVDNGAMIAWTGYHKFLKGQFVDDRFPPLARYPII
ncbi:MAG TPA: tRNA (adenosine(37)-N6)-threonylcarbamoyltransferase complex transferase subunit TsaD [Saprospiraceae bacterium]|nr:tRNA (adenosine(37)-N6)-threonylcarbamoyltransferase complex transferase subunit TsaD [Saprospiraceae bacterium]